MDETGLRLRTVQGYFEAVDANDVAGLLRAFHDDAVYERPGYAAIEGMAALRHFYEQVRVIAGGKHTVEGIIVQGDRAAAWGSFEGTSRTGEPLAERWADVYQFEGALIRYRRSHFYRPAI
jgi:ketosteroid isomerase-like protein